MNFLNEIYEQGRRITADALSGNGINRDAPYSPEVPEHLSHWLPDLFDRFPIVLPWEQPKYVDPALHTVWILDNTAFRSPQEGDHRPELQEVKDINVYKPSKVNGNQQPSQPSGWEVEIVTAFFIKNSAKDLTRAVADIAKQLNIGSDDIATRKRIQERLQPFADTVLPNRFVRVVCDGKDEITLGPSSYQGISSALYPLHSPPPSSGMLQTTPTHLPPPFSIPGTTVVADETGWGIISDIDDTIKVTLTPSPTGILHSTFVVETPEPIQGMPDLYAQMSHTLNTPPFFYLSASPYNLYPFLRRFRDAHYPQGTIILRDASWQNLGGLISSLTQDVQKYKVARIHKIHSWFPHRKFICLGDSTQSDPESYGEIARTYPGWVGAIFIRKVEGIAEMDIETKNKPERFEKAFKGLDRKLWHVFTDPRELGERIEELRRGGDVLVGGE